MRLLESSLYLPKYHLICSQGALLETSNTQIWVLRSTEQDWRQPLSGPFPAWVTWPVSLKRAADDAQPGAGGWGTRVQVLAFPFTSSATLEATWTPEVTSGICLWKYLLRRAQWLASSVGFKSYQWVRSADTPASTALPTSSAVLHDSFPGLAEYWLTCLSVLLGRREM